MITIASIDPGATSGLLIVKLPGATGRVDELRLRSLTYDLDRARFVAAYTIETLGATNRRTHSQRRAPLFEKTRRYLVQHEVNEVVIERPSDIILGGFKSAKRKKSGEATGTAFGLGNHFGLIEAAALDAGVDRITCYTIRTHEQPPKSGQYVLGWMQRREKITPARELTLLRCRARLQDLLTRPYDGILRQLKGDLADENVHMATGVLQFHCDMESGRA